MNEALTTLMLGIIITAVVRLSKKYLPHVNPLIWVGLLAFVGGMIYSFIVPLIPTEIMEKIWFGFSSAVAFYEVMKHIYTAKESKQEPAQVAAVAESAA